MIDLITQTSRTMGIEEFLLDRAKKEGIKEGVERGIELGSEREKRDVVSRLLTKTNFSTNQIADIVGVSVAFVRKVKKDIAPESDASEIG